MIGDWCGLLVVNLCCGWAIEGVEGMNRTGGMLGMSLRQLSRREHKGIRARRSPRTRDCHFVSVTCARQKQGNGNACAVLPTLTISH